VGPAPRVRHCPFVCVCGSVCLTVYVGDSVCVFTGVNVCVLLCVSVCGRPFVFADAYVSMSLSVCLSVREFPAHFNRSVCHVLSDITIVPLLMAASDLVSDARTALFLCITLP
jgi:hypothetical protein